MKLRKLFVAALLLMAGLVQVSAQDMTLPQDKNVRVGKLDNGLTYYIRHNNYPEKVANYYIATVPTTSRTTSCRSICRASAWSMVAT